MKITTPLTLVLALALCGFEMQVRAGCYANVSYRCHTASPGTPYTCPQSGLIIYVGISTDGFVSRAANHASPGLDSLGYYDTTCDYTTTDENCIGGWTNTGHSDPFTTYYARGNRCGSGG